MLSMLPIDEFDVIESLNQGRFEGRVEGYIMMEGPAYLGYALFRVEQDVTTVLDAALEEDLLLDGMVRACVAAGQNRGAGRFDVRMDNEGLARWWDKYCADAPRPAGVDRIFSQC